MLEPLLAHQLDTRTWIWRLDRIARAGAAQRGQRRGWIYGYGRIFLRHR